MGVEGSESSLSGPSKVAATGFYWIVLDLHFFLSVFPCCVVYTWALFYQESNEAVSRLWGLYVCAGFVRLHGVFEFASLEIGVFLPWTLNWLCPKAPILS